jgi:hypothetical protein
MFDDVLSRKVTDLSAEQAFRNASIKTSFCRQLVVTQKTFIRSHVIRELDLS